MKLSSWLTVRQCSTVLILAVAGIACSQYEHNSPDPGVVDVRLAVKNNRQDLIPFGFENSFFFTMKSCDALDAQQVKLPIFSDLHAIRRNPNGDEFNALSPEARDSVTVLGQSFSPPQNYSGLVLVMDEPDPIFISFGFYASLIPVSTVSDFQGSQVLSWPGGISVETGMTTRVTVTFDLDSSLTQLPESFMYEPHFYISSVEKF